GVEGAQVALENLHKQIVESNAWPIQRISKTYVRCEMTPPEWQRLLGLDTETAETKAREAAEKAARDGPANPARDAAENAADGAADRTAGTAPPPATAPPIGSSMRYRAIYKLWPDFPVETQIFRSMPTIKADAAKRAYEATGADIVWAVVDSGIDGTHPHFHS